MKKNESERKLSDSKHLDGTKLPQKERFFLLKGGGRIEATRSTGIRGQTRKRKKSPHSK